MTNTASARLATNSTSLERKPASYEGSFVRGKSSYFPFKPGGLGDLVSDGDDEGDREGGVEKAAEGLEKAFEKGQGAFRLLQCLLAPQLTA